MRNYIRVKALWYHYHQGGADGELMAFGSTLEQLMSYMQPQVGATLAVFPNAIFDKHGPFNLYFELNAENFATILNGTPTGDNFAYHVWNSTMLNERGLTPVANISPTFHDITAVESPRKTWSHGH